MSGASPSEDDLSATALMVMTESVERPTSCDLDRCHREPWIMRETTCGTHWQPSLDPNGVHLGLHLGLLLPRGTRARACS